MLVVWTHPQGELMRHAQRLQPSILRLKTPQMRFLSQVDEMTSSSTHTYMYVPRTAAAGAGRRGRGAQVVSHEDHWRHASALSGRGGKKS